MQQLITILHIWIKPENCPKTKYPHPWPEVYVFYDLKFCWLLEISYHLGLSRWRHTKWPTGISWNLTARGVLNAASAALSGPLLFIRPVSQTNQYSEDVTSGSRGLTWPATVLFLGTFFRLRTTTNFCIAVILWRRQLTNQRPVMRRGFPCYDVMNS